MHLISPPQVRSIRVLNIVQKAVRQESSHMLACVGNLHRESRSILFHVHEKDLLLCYA